MSLVILPDVELMMLRILRAEEELMALAPGGAHKKIPDNPSWPLLRVQRIGGAQEVPGWLDAARVQLEAWDDTEANGGSEFAARELAAAASSTLVNHPGGVIEDLGVLSDVLELLGPTRAPDPKTNRPRYLVDLQVSVHPIP